MSNGKGIWRLLFFFSLLGCVVGIYIPHTLGSIFHSNIFLFSIPLTIVLCVSFITTIVNARPKAIYLCNIWAAIIGVTYSVIDSKWVGRYVSIGLTLSKIGRAHV